MTMTGQQVPAVNLYERRAGDSSVYTTAELFAGQTVVLFAVPAAYTPTCSNKHLPGFEAAFDELQQCGVDRVICLSVNDAWVMEAWGEQVGANKVQMLADGNAQFTTAMGLDQDLSQAGFGVRSKRYSMLVCDSKIDKMFIEDKGFEVSDAQTMLDYLKQS